MPGLIDSVRYVITADDQTGRGFGSAQAGLNKISGAATRLTGLLASLGVTLSVGAFAAFAKRGIDAADSLRDLANRVGTTTETLSGLKFAAEQNGVAVETLVSGLSRFQRQLGEAGVKTNDLQGILLSVARRYQSLSSETERTALVFRVFGRGAGPELKELLSQGESGIVALTNRAEELGLVVSTEAANAADDFNDKLVEMESQVLAASVALGEGFVQGVGDFTGSLASSETLGAIRQFGKTLGETIAEIGQNLETVTSAALVLGSTLAGLRAGGPVGAAVGAAGGVAASVGIFGLRNPPPLGSFDEFLGREAIDASAGGGDFVGPPEPAGLGAVKREREIDEFLDQLRSGREEKEAASAAKIERTRRSAGLASVRDEENVAREIERIHDEGVRKAAEDLNERLANLRDSLQTELEAEQARHTESLALLAEAQREENRLKVTAITDFAALRERVEVDHQNRVASIQEAALADQNRQSEEQQRIIQQPFLNAIDGIQGAFSDAFISLFEGGIKTFGDLADTIKRIFIRLAAEIATLLVFRPIVGQVLGGLGLSALGGSAGGAGGGGAGSSLLQLGGQIIPTLASGFFGGGAGTGVAGGAGILSSLFSGISTPKLGVAAALAAQELGLPGLSGIAGSAFTNVGFGAIGGLLAKALGLGGGTIADTLFSGLGSLGGAALGAQFGAAGGPIGAVIGAIIGTLAGGLIKATPPRGFVTADLTGITDSGGKKGFDAIEGLKPFVDTLNEAFKVVGKELGLNLGKEIDYWIGYKAGRGFRTTIANRGEVDFPDTKEGREQLLTAIFQQELRPFIKDKDQPDFARRALGRALEKDTIQQSLGQIQRDIGIRDFFDPNSKQNRQEGTFESLKAALAEFKKTFGSKSAQALELGISREDIRARRREGLFQILGPELRERIEGAGTAGKQLDRQLADIDKTFRLLAKSARVLGVTLEELEQIQREVRLTTLAEGLGLTPETLAALQQAQSGTTTGTELHRQIRDLVDDFDVLEKRSGELGIGIQALAEIQQQTARGIVAGAAQGAGLSEGVVGSIFGEDPSDLSDRLSDIAELFDELRKSSSDLGLSLEDLADAQEQANLEAISSALELERTLVDRIKSVGERLGIPGLQSLRDSLNQSEFLSPLDRLAAARTVFEQTRTAARAGDLEAIARFPDALQNLLSISRDVFASGPEFQRIFTEGNRDLNDLLRQQTDLQQSIIGQVDLTLRETSDIQVRVMREQTQQLVAELQELRRELRRAK